MTKTATIKTLRDADGNHILPKTRTDAVYNAENKDVNALLDEKAFRSTVLHSVITPTWVGTSAPFAQSIAVPGVTATSIVEISLRNTSADAQLEEFQSLCLQDGGQAENTITLKAYGWRNTADLPITIVVRGDV